jgi:transposase
VRSTRSFIVALQQAAVEFAMAGRQLAPLILSDDERSELKSLLRRRKPAQALALRARIVLACAEGCQNKDVAAGPGVDKVTVGKWRRRFVLHRVDGLRDELRSGAPRTIGDSRIETVIVTTLESVPKEATHWSSRGMAKASGLSVSSVQRVWRAFGLQPHRMETFKLSTGPDCVAKVRDVVGLYVSPPQHAVVPFVDEKSQIPALDRSQQMIPMRPGQPTRHAQETADPNWLAKRPRWHVHLTPTSASWLGRAILALLTDKKIRRGIYRSVNAFRAERIGLSFRREAS